MTVYAVKRNALSAMWDWCHSMLVAYGLIAKADGGLYCEAIGDPRLLLSAMPCCTNAVRVQCIPMPPLARGKEVEAGSSRGIVGPGLGAVWKRQLDIQANLQYYIVESHPCGGTEVGAGLTCVIMGPGSGAQRVTSMIVTLFSISRQVACHLSLPLLEQSVSP